MQKRTNSVHKSDGEQLGLKLTAPRNPKSLQTGVRYDGMNTMNRRRMQFSVFGVAALAIVAVASVMLLAVDRAPAGLA